MKKTFRSCTSKLVEQQLATDPEAAVPLNKHTKQRKTDEKGPKMAADKTVLGDQNEIALEPCPFPTEPQLWAAGEAGLGGGGEASMSQVPGKSSCAPMGLVFPEKLGKTVDVGGGLWTSTLRLRARAIPTFGVWLSINYDVPFPSGCSNTTWST